MKSKKKSNLNLDATPKSESKSGNRRKNLENHHGSGASARKMDRKRSQSPEQNSQNLARADDVEKPKENGGEQERIQACGTTDLSPDAVCNKEEDFHLKPSFPKICEESNSLQQMDKTVVGYPADHVPLHADISELGSNVAPKTPETPVTQEVVRECHGRLPPLPSFFFSVWLSLPTLTSNAPALLLPQESTDYLDRLFPEDQFDEDDTDYKDELEAFAKRLEMPWDGNDLPIAA